MSATETITEALGQYHLGDRPGCLQTLRNLKEKYADPFSVAERYNNTGAIQPEAIAWCSWVQLAIDGLHKDLVADIVAPTGVPACLNTALQFSDKATAETTNFGENEDEDEKLGSTFDPQYLDQELFKTLQALARANETDILIDSLQQVYARQALEHPTMKHYYTRVANALTDAFNVAY